MSESSSIRNPCQNHSDRESGWSPRHGVHYCTECYVDNEVPMRFIFHSDVPQWVIATYRREKFLENLIQVWKKSGRMPYIDVHVFTRAEAATLEWHLRWVARHYNDVPPQRPYYGYRAWADYWTGKIVILVDDTETEESLEWIFWHELSHICVRAAPLFERATEKENARIDLGAYSWEDDEQHERCAEEQFVNHVATMMMGGKNLNRLWWRKRVNEKLEREKIEKWIQDNRGAGEAE